VHVYRARARVRRALEDFLEPGGTDVVNCRELVELVTDYLEGSMPADQRTRFDEHVSRCDGCTRYLEQFRITIRLTGMLSENQFSPDARETLLGVFRDWRASA
jgi:Putative zinc-finger